SIAGDSRCPGFQTRARGPVGARLVGLVFPGLVFPLTPVLFGLWAPTPSPRLLRLQVAVLGSSPSDSRSRRQTGARGPVSVRRLGPSPASFSFPAHALRAGGARAAENIASNPSVRPLAGERSSSVP